MPFLPLAGILLSGSLALLSPSPGTESVKDVRTDVTVSFQLRHPPAESPKDFKVRGVARWFGEGKLEPIVFELPATEPATVKLRPGRWELRAEAAGYWGAPFQLELGDTPALARLDLWQAGKIEGGFVSETGAQPPAELALFFRPSPESEKPGAVPASKVSCPVDQGTWKCVVPAGVMDLRIQAAGFVPRYLWGVRVAPGEIFRPGKMDLRQGSAVLGWVVTADRSPLGNGTKVTLRPRIGGAVRDPAEKKRLESLRFETTLNPRGFFQIDGVPPGAYILEARHERYASASASVRVLPGEVTEIANPPLLLDYPKTVEVFVDPPTGPEGQPWSLKLQQLDRDSSVITTVEEGAVGSEGSWKRAGVAPGRYLLRIGLRGNNWWLDEIDVDESLSPVHIRMETVKVRGTVRLGKLPLAATLGFGGQWGAVRIEARSDEKGRFETLLPKSGEWLVQVTAEDPRVEREIPKVRIDPKPGTDLAEVDLKLPNTVLRGQVRIEGGGPAAEAIVTAMSDGDTREPSVQVWTDEDGRFEIRGLLPGPTLLQADAGDELFADPVSTDVQEDSGDSRSVILYARPQMKVTGVVGSSAGPVAGARIKAAPAGMPYIGLRTVATDAQGRFEVRLPPKTQEMILTVAAPGFAFRILRVPVPEDRKLGIGVEQLAGTLVIEPQDSLDYRDPNSPMVYLLRGGAVENLPTLLAWAATSGAGPRQEGRAVIPGVEPGDYQVCLALPSERLGLDFGITPPDRCAGGTLASNGELTLKVPGLRAARD